MTYPMPVRGLLGFAAAVLSVLIFHEGMIALLHVTNLPGLAVGAPYAIDPVAPYGVPRIVNLCFWGGLYGIAFGLAAPALPRPLWLCGVALGCIAALAGIFLVPAVKGTAIGGGWHALNWVRSFLINGFWGLGVGVIYPLLARRQRSPRLHDA